MNTQSMKDLRNALIEVLGDSENYQALLAENKRPQERIKSLEEDLRNTIAARDGLRGRLNQVLGELADLKLPAVRPTCASCKHWESPEAWAARNPDSYDENPDEGQCHEGPSSNGFPAHDWCAKHVPR